jgi:hypothetical protein
MKVHISNRFWSFVLISSKSFRNIVRQKDVTFCLRCHSEQQLNYKTKNQHTATIIQRPTTPHTGRTSTSGSCPLSLWIRLSLLAPVFLLNIPVVYSRLWFCARLPIFLFLYWRFPFTLSRKQAYKCLHKYFHTIYSETCIRRNRMGPKIFSTLDKFPHYTK